MNCQVPDIAWQIIKGAIFANRPQGRRQDLCRHLPYPESVRPGPVRRPHRPPTGLAPFPEPTPNRPRAGPGSGPRRGRPPPVHRPVTGSAPISRGVRSTPASIPPAPHRPLSGPQRSSPVPRRPVPGAPGAGEGLPRQPNSPLPLPGRRPAKPWGKDSSIPAGIIIMEIIRKKRHRPHKTHRRRPAAAREVFPAPHRRTFLKRGVRSRAAGRGPSPRHGRAGRDGSHRPVAASSRAARRPRRTARRRRVRKTPDRP